MEGERGKGFSTGEKGTARAGGERNGHHKGQKEKRIQNL